MTLGGDLSKLMLLSVDNIHGIGNELAELRYVSQLLTSKIERIERKGR